jgi:tripartite-type tricarboxylate transporter receptor subunit TctC
VLRAEGYPTKPIHLVIPYAAGGGTDLMVRVLQEPLATALGQPIVLIANPSVPAKDVASFIAWARQQKNGVSYASAGAGSIGHLSAELFAKMADVKFVHVPYRGQAPTLNAILAGDTAVAFTSSSDAMLAHVKAGKIRLLGVGSVQPTPLVPGGEPIARALPGYKADFWQGILAPAKTPDAIVTRVSQEVARILSAPEMQAKYNSLSYAASTNTPSQFASMIGREVQEWKVLIAERHIQIES